MEKNSAILGDVAGSAAIASGFGAPLGASIISAGNIGQQIKHPDTKITFSDTR